MKSWGSNCVPTVLLVERVNGTGRYKIQALIGATRAIHISVEQGDFVRMTHTCLRKRTEMVSYVRSYA